MCDSVIHHYFDGLPVYHIALHLGNPAREPRGSRTNVDFGFPTTKMLQHELPCTSLLWVYLHGACAHVCSIMTRGITNCQVAIRRDLDGGGYMNDTQAFN